MSRTKGAAGAAAATTTAPGGPATGKTGEPEEPADEPDPTPWHVRLLGGFEISGPHGRVDIPPSGQRVVAYLALHRRHVRRNTVAAHVWPDVGEARARANLRSAVWRIGVMAPLLEATTATLGIAREVTVDLAALEEHVAAAHGAGGVPVWPRHELDLELLPGWEDEWVELERERVRQLELHVLDGLVAWSVEQGRAGDGIDAALRAIRLDPLRESSHAGLLRALLAGGNRAAAITHFRRFAGLMRDELGLSPSRDLMELIGEILPARTVRRV
jgi:DNA-binding SARP family transcriptional activator